MMHRRLIHKIVGRLASWGVFNSMSDEKYIKLIYWARMGKKLNLCNPQTFNEKLQWLKLYDRKAEYTRMVDKSEAKEYVSNIIGEEYIIPTLGVWDRFEDIEFDSLPNQFVLKCTHDSGGLVICRDLSRINMEEVQKKIQKSLKKNYYLHGREWPYKKVPHKIIAETYMGDNLQDYKIFCFNGKPRITLVCTDRFSETGLCEDFFDNDWNHLELKRPHHDNYSGVIRKPQDFSLMLELAERLAEKLPFVRIDFYEINEKIYFGEITFYPANGFEGFVPEEWDTKLGSWIQL